MPILKGGSMAEERLLTKAEVAEILNIKPSIVAKWASQEKIPSYKLGKGLPTVRYKLSEILQWLESKKRRQSICF